MTSVYLILYFCLSVTVSVVSNCLVMIVTAAKKGRGGRLYSSHVCTLSLAVADTAFCLLVHTLMMVTAMGLISPEDLFQTRGKLHLYYRLHLYRLIGAPPTFQNLKNY